MGAYKDMKYGWVTYDKNSTFLENDYFTKGKGREVEFSNIEIYLVLSEFKIEFTKLSYLNIIFFKLKHFLLNYLFYNKLKFLYENI